MIKLLETQNNQHKSFSKSKSKEQMQLALTKELQKGKEGIKTTPKPTLKASNKTKSQSKQKSNQKSSKDSKRQGSCSKIPTEKANSKQNLLIHNRKRLTASEDKLLKKDKFFKRKNKNDGNRNSNSKKDSKKSTDNQNEETEIQRLKAENEYYKKAFLTSKMSLQKLQKYLEQQKRRRNNNKDWFKHQINNLKKKISCEKIQLGHIFTFDSFQHDQISNMIIQTQNEGSSLVAPAKLEDDLLDALSDLSIESK